MNRATIKRNSVVVAGASALVAGLLTVISPAVHASVPLSPVRNLVASVTGDVATVSWQAPVQGSVGRYQVQALLGGPLGSDYGTRITSATSIQWDRMPFNQPVSFLVTPIGPDGAGYASGPSGPVNETGEVTAANGYCPSGSSGDCVVINTLAPQAPETRPALGILNDPEPPGNQYAAMLHLTHWRLSANAPGVADDALAYVPATGLIEQLSDAWYTHTAYRTMSGRTYVLDPWLDWNVYTSFIQSIVRQANSEGIHPYWEIQNEPENYPYAPTVPPTRSLVEQEYLHAYYAIKSVDPSALVIGPTIDWAYETTAANWYIDMKSFIPFAAANGMKLAGIAWHDDAAQTDTGSLLYIETPEAVRDHSQQVRELIAENPGIGNPALMVDENSSGPGQYSPGWQVGYLAEEDRAGVAEASRSCWPYPGQNGGAGPCDGPYLDELLNQDLQPNSSFWSMVDYATMNGNRVWSGSNDADISSLAVTDSSGTTRILLGRHTTCEPSTSTAQYCTASSNAPSVPTVVDVLIPTAATSVTVTGQELPDSRADLPTAPYVARATAPVSGGVVQLNVPAFQDGEAYFTTVTPNVTSGSAPPSASTSVQEVPAATGVPTPTRMLVEGGDYQSTRMFNYFPAPLSELVTDQYGNPLVNRQVTFGLPGGHATFSTGGNVAVVTTDANGIATSPPVKSGVQGGGFVAFSYLTGLGAVAPWPSAYFALTVRA